MILANHGIISSSGGVLDDAQAFIAAANITDNTQKSAITTLVTDLKAYNIWDKMKAIYPFVGGSSSSHKFNLKDPRDLDAAFRLVFYGGWTHSNSGVLPNGSNAYSSAFFVPSVNGITTANGHLSVYSRNTNLNGLFPIDMGVDQPGTGFNITQKMDSAGGSGSYKGRAFAQTIDNIDSSNTAGLHLLSRTSTTSLKYIRNGNLIQTNTNTENGTVPNISMFIGATNNNGVAGLYSSRELAFATIGNGLSDSEASNFYTAVQNFNTTLSRQV